MEKMITIHKVLEPIAEWYGGGTEGNRSDLDIIIDVVSDLQKDREVVLKQKKRIKELESVMQKCINAMKDSNCLEEQWLIEALKR